MRARDAVIVGGGPAGSVTALLLARAGFDVELLERREFPRAKPCGDCISPGANDLLRRLGVWDGLISADAAQLNGWSLSAGRDAAFTATFASPADVSLAMPRAKLDAILLDAARAAGARIRTGVRVAGLLREGDRVNGVDVCAVDEVSAVYARVIVGADGLRSRVARLLKAYRRPPRARKVSFTAHVRGVPDLSPYGEMHVQSDACLGIARVSNGAKPLCNVTLVLGSPQRGGARGAHETMRAGLRRFSNRDLSDLIRDDDEILTSGPFDWPTRRIGFDGAALVGDAAGYYDPFTGQGIYQAIAGAELLAANLDPLLRHGRMVDAHALVQYAKDHRALTSGARMVQHAVDYVCARPRLARVFFTGLARAPACAQQLVAVTGDVRPARALLSPIFLARLAVASTSALVS